MRRIFLFTLIGVLASQTIFCQTFEQSDKAGKSAVKWSEFSFVESEIGSVRLPDYLKLDLDLSFSDENDQIPCKNYNTNWKASAPGAGSNIDEVIVGVMAWNAGFAKVKKLPPAQATPEKLLTAGFNNLSKLAGALKIEKLEYYKVDGQNGILMKQSGYHDDANKKVLSWMTYRYFNHKAQEIVIHVVAPESGMPTARQIIDSLKLTPPKAIESIELKIDKPQ